MPELPEVETVVRSLAPHIVNKKIIRAEVFYPKSIAMPAENLFCRRMVNEEFISLSRRGKYILLFCKSGCKMIVHLRMTGQLLFTTQAEPLHKHTIAVWHLANGEQIRFVDQRRFGRVWFLTRQKQEEQLAAILGLASLGPEPLSADFTVEYLYKALQNKKMPAKGFLLDQTNIAGLGNIYADEILFAAGIDPRRKACTLTEKEAEALHKAIRMVLGEALVKQGTTIRDYRDGLGIKGSFQDFLKVYGKEGQPCARCHKPLVHVKITGRSSCFCPDCQR